MVTLNTDCLDMILSQLEHDPRTLFNTLTVCRTWFTIASAILYRFPFNPTCSSSSPFDQELSSFSFSRLDHLLGLNSGFAQSVYDHFAETHHTLTYDSPLDSNLPSKLRPWANPVTLPTTINYYDLVSTMPAFRDTDHKQEHWLLYLDSYAEKLESITIFEPERMNQLIPLVPRFKILRSLSIPTLKSGMGDHPDKVVENVFEFIKQHYRHHPGTLIHFNLGRDVLLEWRANIQLRQEVMLLLTGPPSLSSLTVSSPSPPLVLPPTLSTIPSFSSATSLSSSWLSPIKELRIILPEKVGNNNNNVEDSSTDHSPGGRMVGDLNLLPVAGLKVLSLVCETQRIAGQGGGGGGGGGEEGGGHHPVGGTGTGGLDLEHQQRQPAGTVLQKCRLLESLELVKPPQGALQWAVKERQEWEQLHHQHHPSQQQKEQPEQEQEQGLDQQQHQQPYPPHPGFTRHASASSSLHHSRPLFRDSPPSLVPLKSFKGQGPGSVLIDALYAFQDSLEQIEYRPALQTEPPLTIDFESHDHNNNSNNSTTLATPLVLPNLLGIDLQHFTLAVDQLQTRCPNLQTLILSSPYGRTSPWTLPTTLRTLYLSANSTLQLDIYCLKELIHLESLHLECRSEHEDDFGLINLSDWSFPSLTRACLYGRWAIQIQGQILTAAPKLSHFELNLMMGHRATRLSTSSFLGSPRSASLSCPSTTSLLSVVSTAAATAATTGLPLSYPSIKFLKLCNCSDLSSTPSFMMDHHASQSHESSPRSFSFLLFGKRDLPELKTDGTILTEAEILNHGYMFPNLETLLLQNIQPYQEAQRSILWAMSNPVMEKIKYSAFGGSSGQGMIHLLSKVEEGEFPRNRPVKGGCVIMFDGVQFPRYQLRPELSMPDAVVVGSGGSIGGSSSGGGGGGGLDGSDTESFEGLPKGWRQKMAKSRMLQSKLWKKVFNKSG